MSRGPGRPTTYSEEMLKKTLEYIDACEDSEEGKLKVKLPSIEGLAFELKVDKVTLYNWEKEYPQFFNALNTLRAKQANVVLNKGLSGDYNPTIAKLILSNNHGYKERTDTTTNDKDINEVTPKIKKLAEEYEQKLKNNL